MRIRPVRLLIGVVLAVCALGNIRADHHEESQAPIERLAPIYRHSMLVTDLDRSLTLYRDILGMTVSRVSETPPDSYSYQFFAIPKGSMKRFAYLNGEGGQKEVLGLGEVPGVDLGLPATPRTMAWVQTVEDVEGVLEKVEALGLEILPSVEFMSREAGKPGIEAGFLDFDGHLILVYGLTREAIGMTNE